MDAQVISLCEYMEQRRKTIDRYVQGEHKWYGDLSTSLPSLSMYSNPLPWYLKHDTQTHTATVDCRWVLASLVCSSSYLWSDGLANEATMDTNDECSCGVSDTTQGKHQRRACGCKRWSATQIEHRGWFLDTGVISRCMGVLEAHGVNTDKGLYNPTMQILE